MSCDFRYHEDNVEDYSVIKSFIIDSISGIAHDAFPTVMI